MLLDLFPIIGVASGGASAQTGGGSRGDNDETVAAAVGAQHVASRPRVPIVFLLDMQSLQGMWASGDITDEEYLAYLLGQGML